MEEEESAGRREELRDRRTSRVNLIPLIREEGVYRERNVAIIVGLNYIVQPNIVIGGNQTGYYAEAKLSSMEAKNSHPPAPQPSPWLVFSHGKRERTQTFFSVSDGSYKVKNIPEMRRAYCWASYFGWLVMNDKTGYFLLDSVSLKKIQLPYSKLLRSFSGCVLSSPPTDPDCLIIAYGGFTNSFMYCPVGCDKWIERKCKLEGSMGSIDGVVCCNGKLYAYDLKRFGIIDVDGDPVIRWLVPEGPKMPPTTIMSYHFVVESHGEIFLVKECHLTTPRVVHFNVYKMDFSTNVWEEVNTLGDRVLFLGWCCSTSCLAADSGIERDCIYFTKPNDKNLYVFHLDRGTISVDLPCPNVRPPWHRPLWVMPMVFKGSEAAQIKQERIQNELELEEMQQEIINQGKNEGIREVTTAEDTDVFAYRPWSDLPVGLLELIVLHLFRVDWVHMTSTCRSWRSVGPPSVIMDRYLPLLTKHDLPLLRNNTPWLMFFQKEDGICNFLDPLYNETYFINTPELSGSTPWYCKDGSVFMYKRDHSVFLFNPFIQVKVQLPDMDMERGFQSASFAYTPTSNDFIIFSVAISLSSFLLFRIYHHGDRYWEWYDLDNNLPFMASFTNPVFFNEVFYVLGHDGKLGVFDPERISWTVLSKPKPLNFCNCFGMPQCKFENYLVESRGELLMVSVDSVGSLGSPVDVYRLELSQMEWVKVESLEDRILFVGFWTCTSSTETAKGMGNKIYFPMVSGKRSVFYSLKDCRCYPNPNFLKSEEFICGTWVEPRWFRPSAEKAQLESTWGPQHQQR